MPSVMAIVSKAVFEKQARDATIGSVIAFDRYASKHAAIAAAGVSDGAIFLVTVRPPDERLWLVGVLERPRVKADGWYPAQPSAVPIVDISGLAKQLVFASGKRLVAATGALGMSLQTPRVLADEDVTRLRVAAGMAASAGKPARSARSTRSAKAAAPSAAPVAEPRTRRGRQAAKSTPARSTPATSAPARSTPATSAPARSTPAMSTPARSPAKSTPARSTPASSTPAKSTPARSTSAKSAPARSTPARSPAKSTPASSTPASSPPAKSPPARSTGSVQPTTRGAPAELGDAITRRDGAAALTAALAWWRDTRSPAVADLVDAISARVSPPAVANDRAFAQLARGRDPLDLGALLAAVPTLPASFLPTAAELLVAFPVDPRLASAVAGWASEPVTTSSSTYRFWTTLLDAVAEGGDVRAIARLKHRLKRPPQRSQFWPRFYAALERVVGKLAAQSPGDAAPPSALVAGVARLVPLAARTGDVVSATAREPAPILTGRLLAQASAHLAAGRTLAAIDAMLERWREVRAPELADLIDRATRLLPTYELPLAASAKAVDPAWHEAFAHDPMATLPQLLQNLNVGGVKLAERRLVELASLADDPRVALRLAELADMFGVSPERTQYWKSLLDLLARIADPRTWAPLRLTFADFTGTYYNHHRQAKRIVGALALAPPVIPPLPGVDRALIDELAAALAAAERESRERALVAAIADAGDDDGPRLVYADWLSERGNPRGELIVLDCKRTRTAADDARRAELLGVPYLDGALVDLATIEDAHRDRGLVRALTVEWRPMTLSWRAAAACPSFALIDTLDLSDLQRPPLPDHLAAALAAATGLRTIVRPLGTAVDVVLPALTAQLGPTWRRDGDALVRRPR